MPALAAVGGELTEFVCDLVQPLCGTLLLHGRLVPRLPLGFAEQVTGLAPGFGDDLARLFRGGLDNLAARIPGVLADVRCFVTSDARRLSGAPAQ
jgi:hypothetical protein